MLPKGLHEGGVVLDALDESDVEIFDFTGAIGRGKGVNMGKYEGWAKLSGESSFKNTSFYTFIILYPSLPPPHLPHP